MSRGSNQAATFHHCFKIVACGSFNTGKTVFFQQFAENKYTENEGPTIGVNFHLKCVTLDDQIVKLQLWDTAGHERHYNTAKTYIKTADGVILMYDITCPDSLTDVERIWHKLYTRNCSPDVPVILVGSRCDLVAKRKVSFDEAHQLAKRLKIEHHMEASAKTGTNVEEAFITLVAEILHKDKSLTAGGAEDGPK